MVYNKEIEARIHNILSKWKNIDKRKMFGGVCYLVNGNMFSGIYKDYLILRLGEENTKKAMESPFVKAFDITGRPMKGWVMIENKGIASQDELHRWLNVAKEFVKKIPAK